MRVLLLGITGLKWSSSVFKISVSITTEDFAFDGSEEFVEECAGLLKVNILCCNYAKRNLVHVFVNQLQFVVQEDLSDCIQLELARLLLHI